MVWCSTDEFELELSGSSEPELQDEKGGGVKKGHHVKKLDIVNGPSSRHSMTSLLEQTVANEI